MTAENGHRIIIDGTALGPEGFNEAAADDRGKQDAAAHSVPRVGDALQ